MTQEINDEILYQISLIPYGKVTTAIDIIDRVGVGVPSAVGLAVRHNLKKCKDLPIHRIVKYDGAIPYSYPFGTIEDLVEKLKSEGIEFKTYRLVNLEKFRWKE